MQLSEYASNIIENLACRTAEANGGNTTPHAVIPYLPVSLGIVERCLNEMVDGTSITSSVENGVTTYTFAAYSDTPPAAKPSDLSFKTCAACDADFPTAADDPICDACESKMRNELNTLAEQMGWPAQAVYEHEILYNAAAAGKPLHPAELAAKSRFTLRSMRRKLDHLAQNRFARKEENPAAGIATYAFPPLAYSRDRYQANMDVILTYPASVMEEVETKLCRIFVILGLMLLVMVGMAFCGFPFPLLMLLFVIVAPITAIVIWRRKLAPNDE